MEDDDAIPGSTGDELHLVVPPYSSYLRRGAARRRRRRRARAQLDCDETEDFRLAVDELCHVLMTQTDHFVVLTLSVEDRRVVARGVARRRSGATGVRLNKLTERLVHALADTVTLDEHDDQVTFLVAKNRLVRAR